jgi:hypothetical protein
MHEAIEAARPPRQAAILAAAVKVFFQFGHRTGRRQSANEAATLGAKPELWDSVGMVGASIAVGLLSTVLTSRHIASLSADVRD